MVTAIALEGRYVNVLFKDCLFTPSDRTSDRLPVQGATQCAVFSRSRVEERRTEIHNFLAQLPESFKADGGGGDSFKNATKDNRGNDWTGVNLLIVVEQLVQLGVAIGEVRYLRHDPMDRSMRFVVEQ